MCLLMEDNWSWLCTENVQKAIRLLFGTFIERWLDVGVARLTSAPCWVLYLQVLQEAVWPGGVLPAQPRPERSAAQRLHTKQQCLERLVQLLPGFFFSIFPHIVHCGSPNAPAAAVTAISAMETRANHTRCAARRRGYGSNGSSSSSSGGGVIGVLAEDAPLG
ncbi:hypothetical protein CRUP_012554 [Coryphaenoides rupestris]|nr:hypothetical protein CRUP_012554 [Coryphaenoides rupestris]